MNLTFLKLVTLITLILLELLLKVTLAFFLNFFLNLSSLQFQTNFRLYQHGGSLWSEQSQGEELALSHL